MDLAALSSRDLLFAATALVAAGGLTGVLAGMFGIGGGSVLVPILHAAFSLVGVPEDVRMHLTLGTAIAVIAPTGLRSFMAQHARGATDIPVLERLCLPVFFGVLAGVLIASEASSAALRWVWVLAGSLVALKLFLGRDDWRLGERLPKSRAIEAAAFLIGMLSALMSIGGGIFVVTLLMLYGYTTLNAIGTSSGFGPVIAITGTLGYMWAGWGVPDRPPFSIGYVNLVAATLLVPASVMTAPLGVRLAHRLPRRALEIAFASFLTLVVARFLWTLA